MAVCAIVYNWNQINFDSQGLRLDVEYLVCDDETNLRVTDTASVFFTPSATVSQIKNAIGAAVRARVVQMWSLTVPQNELVMPEISKV